MNRKIVPEVQQLFDKYSSQANTRRLPRDQAILLLQTEFNIEQWHAEEFYRHYKLDPGNEGGTDALSLWEFQHFYNNVGKRANEIVAAYDSMDNTRSGYIPAEKLKTYIENQKSADGESLSEKEVTMFLKTAAKENELVNLGKFSDLNARLKLYKKPKK